jgi:hypothetical protein
MNNKIFDKGFGKFPKPILFSDSLSGAAKTLYAYLTCYANAENKAFPSVLRIVDEMKIGAAKVRRALKELSKSGGLK